MCQSFGPNFFHLPGSTHDTPHRPLLQLKICEFDPFRLEGWFYHDPVAEFFKWKHCEGSSRPSPESIFSYLLKALSHNPAWAMHHHPPRWVKTGLAVRNKPWKTAWVFKSTHTKMTTFPKLALSRGISLWGIAVGKRWGAVTWLPFWTNVEPRFAGQWS